MAFKRNCSSSSPRQWVHGRVLCMEVSWRGGGVREIIWEQLAGGPIEELQPFEQMVYDVAGPIFVADDEPVHKSEPKDPNHQKFRKLLAVENTPLWGRIEAGC